MTAVTLDIKPIIVEGLTKPEAEARLNELLRAYNKVTDDLESAMIEVALEHNLSLSLGDYGSGRSLVLKDDHWSGKNRGEWLPSSETC